MYAAEQASHEPMADAAEHKRDAAREVSVRDDEKAKSDPSEPCMRGEYRHLEAARWAFVVIAMEASGGGMKGATMIVMLRVVEEALVTILCYLRDRWAIRRICPYGTSLTS